MKNILYTLLLLAVPCTAQPIVNPFIFQTGGGGGTPQTVRFYLSSSAAPATSPAFAGDWTRTSGAQRREMSTTPDASSMANRGNSGQASPAKILTRQYVATSALGAGTFSGTVKGQIRGVLMNVFEGGVAGQFSIVGKIVSSDGSSVRGTFLAYTTFGAGLNSGTQTNRSLTETAITPVVVQDGDLVVLEIGFDYQSGTNTTTNCSGRYGSSAGSDLPQDNSTTTDLRPWFEFELDNTLL